MSNTNNVRLGPCRVFFGGVDLGYTQGGVEVEVKTETHPVMVDQFGKSLINELILGRTVSVKAPLAETTLDNLVRIMPGASIVQTGGSLATGSVTFTAVALAGDTVTINGITLTASASSALLLTDTQFAIGTSAANQAALFAQAVNAIDDSLMTVVATASAAVVTLTAANYDTPYYSSNAITLVKVSTAVTLSGANLTGGVVPSKQMAQITTGVGTSLLAIAQPLVLHPIANADNNKTEDFVIPLAATAGGLKFAYQVDKERIFDVTFMAYPNSLSGMLYEIGDPSA